MRPYVIAALPWMSSAGVRATYHLCDELNRRGAPAFILEATVNRNDPVKQGMLQALGADLALPPPLLDVPPFSAMTQRAKEAAIYMVTEGWAIEAERAVRWFLSRPKDKNADGRSMPLPGPHDFVWAKAFAPSLRQLCVGSIYDFQMFYPAMAWQRRRGVAVWFGKTDPNGIDLAAFDVPGNARVISHTWPRPRQALAEMLRSVELVISFDACSSVNLEATLCGTPVRVHETAEWSRKDIEAAMSDLGGTLGYAWSDADIEQARREVCGAHETVRCASKATTTRDVDAFLGYTQGVFA